MLETEGGVDAAVARCEKGDFAGSESGIFWEDLEAISAQSGAEVCITPRYGTLLGAHGQ